MSSYHPGLEVVPWFKPHQPATAAVRPVTTYVKLKLVTYGSSPYKHCLFGY
jgi:hypothetical protein